MMQHVKLQYQDPFFMERLSSLPLGKFGSKEIILFLIEVAHPLVLGKAPIVKKLDSRPIDSVMKSALSFFLV